MSGKLVLRLSSPVTVSRRSTGVPAARLAASWRMRRSPPKQGSSSACSGDGGVPVDGVGPQPLGLCLGREWSGAGSSECPQ